MYYMQRLLSRLVLAGTLLAAATPAMAQTGSYALITDFNHSTSIEGRPAGSGGDGGGGDIIVWDIVDSNHASASRPAGGGGGVDIVVFDIVDSNHASASRPGGGGGGVDIVVFDIVDS